VAAARSGRLRAGVEGTGGLSWISIPLSSLSELSTVFLFLDEVDGFAAETSVRIRGFLHGVVIHTWFARLGSGLASRGCGSVVGSRHCSGVFA